MPGPVRTLLIAAAAVSVLGVAGCQDTDKAAPSDPPATSAAPTSPAAKPSPTLAGPGTTCGRLVTPGKYAAKVVLAKGHMPCKSAVAVVKRYYRGVKAGKGGGNAATLQVGRFFCASTTAAGASTGRLGSCATKTGKLLIKIKAQTDVN